MRKITNQPSYEKIVHNIKENPDLPAEFIKELLKAKNAATEPFSFEKKPINNQEGNDHECRSTTYNR
ncbi:hypothetical protein [Phascolarctobacterium sp.]